MREKPRLFTIAWVTFLVAEAAISPGDDAAAAEWHAFRTLALDGAAASRSLPPPPPPRRDGAARRPSMRPGAGAGSIKLAMANLHITLGYPLVELPERERFVALVGGGESR